MIQNASSEFHIQPFSSPLPTNCERILRVDARLPRDDKYSLHTRYVFPRLRLDVRAIFRRRFAPRMHSNNYV